MKCNWAENSEWTKRSKNWQKTQTSKPSSNSEKRSRQNMKSIREKSYDSQYYKSWCVREHRNRINIAHLCTCVYVVASTCLKSLNNDGIRVSTHTLFLYTKMPKIEPERRNTNLPQPNRKRNEKMRLTKSRLSQSQNTPSDWHRDIDIKNTMAWLFTSFISFRLEWLAEC